MTHNPEYEKEYRQRPEVILYHHNYYLLHKPKIQKQQKENHIKNKERDNKRSKEYRLNHHEEALAYGRIYRTIYKDVINPKRREKNKLRQRMIRSTPEGKAYQKKRNEEYDWDKYRNEHREKIYQNIKKYNKTEKGKINAIKARGKRQRLLGFEMVRENIFDEPVEWHHLDNKRVIAIPTDIHKLYGGKDSEIHRLNLLPIIQQLYDVSP